MKKYYTTVQNQKAVTVTYQVHVVVAFDFVVQYIVFSKYNSNTEQLPSLSVLNT